MAETSAANRVRHNAALSRYELDAGGSAAVLNYRADGDVLHLVHTETPLQARGQGVASRLVQGALDDIRAKGQRIVPRCSFVRAFIASHPAYCDLVA